MAAEGRDGAPGTAEAELAASLRARADALGDATSPIAVIERALLRRSLDAAGRLER
ncbi:hypothetical protein [Candidatus Palauibacter sp.]|uniref:hypothetical protein n=1 Tax=Candidatus Palauibacter sp. TaxID=3101350 RepID=UPI003B010509